jgi:hypothetical protein
MKKIFENILFVTALASLAPMASCKKSYVDTKPTDAVNAETVFQNTDNAKMAVNGLAKMMTQQYLGSQGFNGEGTIKMYYGNYPGNHFSLNLSGWATVINGTLNDNTVSVYCYYPWYYYYKIIGNANFIIAKVDSVSGVTAQKDFIKAQALTYRAYSFLMLAQLYGNRWGDSNGGSTPGIVLRTDVADFEMPGATDMTRATLLETYQQIYADLNKAIALYQSSGLKRLKNYEVDANVAYAIYARAALTRQDYATAETYAVKARNGYPLMNNAEYSAGFCNPNREWIWSSYGGTDETLYFYSYFAYIAYNSSASAVRTTPKCISRELYNKIPSTDIRRGLFLDPTGYTYTTSTGSAGSTTALYKYAFTARPNLYSTASVYAYMQFKIAANEQPGVGNLNHFRSAEMYLIEAEAKYRQGKPDLEVQNLLVELNNTSGRNASYTCTKTGTALLDEIKLYRAVELWGEGFDWFDMKRWNDPINRKTYANGGNFISSLAVTITPDANNKWTWKLPLRETDFNTLAD